MIYYLYVVDENEKLTGVLSLRDLVIAQDDITIGEVMDEQVVSVSDGRDQVEVAQMMRYYNFLDVRVVDFHNHLLCIIIFVAILYVIYVAANDYTTQLATD